MAAADYWTVVNQQADSLERTVTAVRTALNSAELPSWEPGQLLAVVAMGASTMAAEVLVHEARLRGRVVLNWPAADWRLVPSPLAAIAIGISESGRSPETIDGLARCGGHRLVVTNHADAPVAQHAETVVPLGGIDDAGVYVSGYTSTLAALALIGESLGLAGLTDGLDQAPALVRGWLPEVVAGVDRFLAAHYPDGFPPAVECVGAGAGYAAACETALLLREAGRTPSAYFQTDQYLHGPAEALPGKVCAVVFGNDRADELVARLVALGTPVIHVGASPVAGAHGLALPAASPVVTSILEALVGQVLAGRLGDRRGHEIGTFQHEFVGTKLPETA